MPWCEDCAKYWAPSTMNEDGSCPTCGRSLERTKAETQRITSRNVRKRELATDAELGAAGGPDDPGDGSGDDSGGEAGDEDLKTPWHFKLLMVLLALYLTWRLVQLFM